MVLLKMISFSSNFFIWMSFCGSWCEQSIAAYVERIIVILTVLQSLCVSPKPMGPLVLTYGSFVRTISHDVSFYYTWCSLVIQVCIMFYYYYIHHHYYYDVASANYALINHLDSRDLGIIKCQMLPWSVAHPSGGCLQQLFFVFYLQTRDIPIL